MNETTQAILAPLLRLQEEATKIANDHGFNKLSFAILPRDEDDNAHVQFVAEWDPEQEAVPDAIIVQAGQALAEETQARYEQQLEDDAAKAADELRQQIKAAEKTDREVKIDPSKLRKRGEGFL